METVLTTNELQIDIVNIKKAALIFRAVNNKVRQQALFLLHENRRMTVTSIYEKLRLEQSAASQHLAILRKAGFVVTQREGKCIYYSVNYKRFENFNNIAEQLLTIK
jgi:DNA-binding transcriptional ArsR family regulator